MVCKLSRTRATAQRRAGRARRDFHGVSSPGDTVRSSPPPTTPVRVEHAPALWPREPRPCGSVATRTGARCASGRMTCPAPPHAPGSSRTLGAARHIGRHRGFSRARARVSWSASWVLRAVQLAGPGGRRAKSSVREASVNLARSRRCDPCRLASSELAPTEPEGGRAGPRAPSESQKTGPRPFPPLLGGSVLSPWARASP